MMKQETLDIWQIEKTLRANVVRGYMERNGIHRAVCFSCGHASVYLIRAGVPLLNISRTGDLTPNRWFTQEEIRQDFPGVFDATSGHLPLDLMNDIAARLSDRLKYRLREGVEYILPTGSGETAVCLKIAFPEITFTPRYDDNDPATEYNEQAPLNGLVRAIFPRIIHTYKQNSLTR